MTALFLTLWRPSNSDIIFELDADDQDRLLPTLVRAFHAAYSEPLTHDYEYDANLEMGLLVITPSGEKNLQVYARVTDQTTVGELRHVLADDLADPSGPVTLGVGAMGGESPGITSIALSLGEALGAWFEGVRGARRIVDSVAFRDERVAAARWERNGNADAGLREMVCRDGYPWWAEADFMRRYGLSRKDASALLRECGFRYEWVKSQDGYRWVSPDYDGAH